MITLQSLARQLNGEVVGRRQVLCPGPNHRPHDRSLAVRLDHDAPDGFRVHSFAGDDWRDCRDHVRQLLGLPQWQPGDGRDQRRTIDPTKIDMWDFGTVDREAEVRPRSEEDVERIKRAREIWHNGKEPRGTVAADYLKSRALSLPDDLANGILRFHPRVPWRNEDTGQIDRVACLIAAFRSIDDGEIIAVHRIRVDQPQRWPKTMRKMYGPTHRAAVMLAPIGDELLIGEGVETAMSPREDGMAVPAWALGSAGGIAGFPLLDTVSTLYVATEPDATNARALRIVRERYQRAGKKVVPVRSSVGGDLNDSLMTRRGLRHAS